MYTMPDPVQSLRKPKVSPEIWQKKWEEFYWLQTVHRGNEQQMGPWDALVVPHNSSIWLDNTEETGISWSPESEHDECPMFRPIPIVIRALRMYRSNILWAMKQDDPLDFADQSPELLYTKKIIMAQYMVALQFMEAAPRLPRELKKMPKELLQHANLLTNDIWQQWRHMLPSNVLDNQDEFYHVLWPDPMTLHKQIESSSAHIAKLPLDSEGNSGRHHDVCVRIWEWADATNCIPKHQDHIAKWFKERGAREDYQ